MNRESFTKQFVELNNRIKLKEGKRGLVKVLAVISRFPNKSIKIISQKSSLPVPLCVAIRNEFSKIGWCKRTPSGTIITPKGEEVLNVIGGLNVDFNCDICEGIGVKFPYGEYQTQLENIKRYSELRGSPNTVIDQSFATPETSLDRALFMSHKYDLLWGDIALVGDSDLTSVALSQFVSSTQRIVVFDIDPRVGEIIDKVNEELGQKIEFILHDFREPMPDSYKGKFNTVHTDPPYTRIGTCLFVSRGIELLDKEEGGVIHLSFVIKPPKEMIDVERDLVEMNCLITDIIPGFNKYVGAQKLGGISALYRLLVVPPAVPKISGIFDDGLYTGDVNPIIRVYECFQCKEKVEVGKKHNFTTIEQLKEQGCPKCGKNHFKKIKEDKMK